MTTRPGAAPVILMYHRVAAPAFDPWGLCVSPARFREQLAMLSAERRVMSLDALAAALMAGEAPRFAVALTFDDGYADNATVAAPLLAAAGLPATLFVASGRIGSGRAFWWDELAAKVPDPDAYAAEWRRLSCLEQAAREAELARVGQAAPAAVAEPGALPMDAAMLRAAAADGTFAIGCHARSHEPLTALGPKARREEIAGSRRDLEALLGRAPAGFAYPHGEVDAATARMVAEAGFEWAVAVENRAVPRRGFDRYALPRLTVGDWSAERLRREVRNAGG